MGGREGGREGGKEGGKESLPTCVFRDTLGGRFKSLLANDAAGGFDLKKREGGREGGKRADGLSEKRTNVCFPASSPSSSPSRPPPSHLSPPRSHDKGIPLLPCSFPPSSPPSLPLSLPSYPLQELGINRSESRQAIGPQGQCRPFPSSQCRRPLIKAEGKVRGEGLKGQGCGQAANATTNNRNVDHR